MPDALSITIEPAFHMADIFSEIESGAWRIEQDAAIIWATGPNVLQALEDYPLNCYHMGVNGAVDLPVHLHARLIIDRLGERCGWFTHRLGVYEIVSNVMRPQWANAQVQCHVNEPKLQRGKVTAECTVSGAALSLLYWQYKRWGTPKIAYLAGCDFGGGKYFNGYSTLTPGVWNQKRHMDALIRECEAGGLTVRTLTDTALEVEHASTR